MKLLLALMLVTASTNTPKPPAEAITPMYENGHAYCPLYSKYHIKWYVEDTPKWEDGPTRKVFVPYCVPFKAKKGAAR